MTVQRCTVCTRPHLAELPCWRGRYAARVTKTVLRMQGTMCWVCGRDATTADHIRPRSLGGDDSMANMRPACVPCNSRRGVDANPFTEDRATAEVVPRSGRWAS